ncbi:unnamed protein product [Effrenium voratum]|uniref:Uncharacterized protein n=1 Tax=Effrenium voratum TaxID=2562239 RepID=A0AA36NI83_9DINO|nr:unnamed protein product [Effrenium voratum]
MEHTVKIDGQPNGVARQACSPVRVIPHVHTLIGRYIPKNYRHQQFIESIRSGEYLGSDWPYNFLGGTFWKERRYNASFNPVPPDMSVLPGIMFFPRVNVWAVEWWEQALHNGAWMVLDFDTLECDLSAYFDKDHFPELVLSPHELFLEENYLPLLRPTDEFAAKVTYEHQAALADGAFQDRTKCHAPERVADVSKKFDPKDAFRLVVATKKEELPAQLCELMVTLKVDVSEHDVKENAGRWAGREQTEKTKSKEQLQLDGDLLEYAFDGDLEAIQKLLEKSADPMAKAMMGALPCTAPAFKGIRLSLSCCWNAADRHGERPFDMASNDETRAVLEAWDVSKTDTLKEARAAAVDAEDEKNVRNDEERLQLERRKLTGKLCELAEQGDKDALKIELLDIPRDKAASYRDDRGNNVLHVATMHGKQDVVSLLVEEFGFPVNAQDAKGWTPIAIAAFHGYKKVCQVLMTRKADPLIENAYRKDAFAVAKDDEIRDVLKGSNPGALIRLLNYSSILFIPWRSPLMMT